jgi:S1-C subfamily serine protease
MQEQSSATGTWQALSNQTANAVEKAARTIVAVQGRRRVPASGVHWRPGIIVTASHALEHDDEINVTLPGGRTTSAKLAGRDPSTDIAVLKMNGIDLPIAEIGDTSALKPGNFILAAACTAEGSPRAAMALVSVTGPAWRTWLGGALDQTLRLDRNLHPNFSGGPAIDDQGRVLGINTSALSRFAAVVIPASTVHRVTAELETKGRIGRGYLGVGMAPVILPPAVRESLKLSGEASIMVMAVEPASPAAQAGVMLGDIFVAFDAKPLLGLRDVQAYLGQEYIGKPLKASIIRGGKMVEATITVGERPAVN